MTTVDRLRLRVAGGDAEDGRRLGELVADRLVPSLHGDADVDRLRVRVAARRGEGDEALAARIAAAVAAALASEAGL